ncbi:MAG: AAA family ATPase [bacterium]|nr:AAA family ATPase [bacterium]
MRRFFSYGPLNPKIHYYSPREALITKAYNQLLGENPEEGGHYITVWAPRQTGKSWLMMQLALRLQNNPDFQLVHIPLEHLKLETDPAKILSTIAEELGDALGKDFTGVDDQRKFQYIFKNGSLDKPLILILDEFDALPEKGINAVVSAFRNIYNRRRLQPNKSPKEKSYLLHGVALIGVRSVLGIDNEKGSPFNVQRSLHVPNLTSDETRELFKWYEKESGQKIEQRVIDKLYNEMSGQPGLTCWFGELLTETLNPGKNKTISMKVFNDVYKEAVSALPNNNILNIISKADREPHKNVVLELFKTDRKMEFRFDDKALNYLFMNGIIDVQKERNSKDELEVYCKFANPFVQGRLFNYFSREMFHDLGLLIHPLDDMNDAIGESEKSLHIPNIVKRYKTYLKKNKDFVFNGMPRRKSDKRIYEAVYHFNFFRYLYDLLTKRGISVIPEFPTGNGKIDLTLKYGSRVYAIELKSFKDMYDYRQGIEQAARYGIQLGLEEIVLLVFVELKEEEVKELEQIISKPGINIIVIPVAVQ